MSMFAIVLATLCGLVDPFIGTSATGHTFPAACVPFGLIQAGPDSGNGNWHYCSGYRYEDNRVTMFSQTHLNGTGGADLGDFGMLPFRGEKVEPSSISHNEEIATPGFYSVKLKEAEVEVDISATEHAAIYRMRGKGELKLLVDVGYGITNGGGNGMIEATPVFDKQEVRGISHRKFWVERTYAYCAKFSHRAKNRVDEGKWKSVYTFDLDECGGELLIKVGISSKGEVAGAERNLMAEIPDWNFARIRATASEKWEKILACATIEGTLEQKKNFYTSLYHLFIQPNNIADVGENPFYSTFSCWDTFRAAHPLYTIIAPQKVPAMIDSMLHQGRITGYLPIWTLWGVENQCMIGTHSIPVIVDAYLKGFPMDAEEAYRQIKDSLTGKHDGRLKEQWELYDRYGYYPYDEIHESVSRTMECGYDDWCAGVMAKKLGKKEDAAFFFKRSGYWKNVFDSRLRLVRGKDSKGQWRTPYNPYTLGHGEDLDNDFTEGNAFQYTWHVMQDPDGLIAAMGGRAEFVKKLDSLFTENSQAEGQGELVDVTGLIGQYVHGNEPSHHVIYFYPLVGEPDKAADRIREVFDRFYLPKVDGLCGNDDCGQMSAWYIFSAMGFYPFNPCGGDYVIGAPQIPKIELKLPEGKKFTVIAKGLSKTNRRVKAITLNGKPFVGPILKHAEIMAGGELVFEMWDGRAAFIPEAATGAAIQQAIDKANAAGGGIVRLEPKEYLSGTIYLKSGVELNIPEGAVLKGYDDWAKYDDVDDPRIRKTPEKSKKAFIACIFQNEVAITGGGVIDGQGVKFYNTDPKKRVWNMYPKPSHPRPRMLEFVGCKNVRFEDVTFKDSPGWTCWARMCENFSANRVKILADQLMINNDGFHIDGCRHIRIRNCVCRTGDDSIVMRAIQTSDGESNLCEDMIVEACVLDSNCQAIRLGCPSDGTIRNGVFRRLKMSGRNGITSINPVNYLQEGSYGSLKMENLLFEDCEIDVRERGICYQVDKGIKLDAFGNTTFRNIKIKSGLPLKLEGNDCTDIVGIKLEQVSIDVVSKVKSAPTAINTTDGWERLP